MAQSISGTVSDGVSSADWSTVVSIGSLPIIPADRNFPWNPGMTSKGGIPVRSAVYVTLPEGTAQAAIQTALDNCPPGQVVVLGPGTFTVNNYLLVHTGITLRGSGAGVTVLQKTNGAAARLASIVPGTTGIHTPGGNGGSADQQPIIIVGPSRWCGPDSTTSKALGAGVLAGVSSILIGSVTGFSVGQFVLIDELSKAAFIATPTGYPGAAKVLASDRLAWNIHSPAQPGDDPTVAKSWFCRNDRPTCEIKEIASIVGDTLTFTSPLAMPYRSANTAQVTRYTATGGGSGSDSRHITMAGVEALTLVGASDGALRFECAAYCWARNVEIMQWIGEGVAIDNSFRIEVRDSYIHTGSWPEPGGAGYAISLSSGSSEILIENNITVDTCKNIVDRSCGSGSVVAYNYFDDSWDFDTPTWVEVGANASHMAGPHHVLFEGNYSHNFDSDYTHGNAIYLTCFRNWFSGQRRSFTDGANIRCVGLAFGSWWDSFVGNLLGRPGLMTGWLYTDPAMSCDANGNNCTGNNANWTDRSIWRIGYDPEAWGMHPDPKTISLLIRDGNWDFLTNSQSWHTTPPGFPMPNSMYLSAKPAFFGANPWPWTDPSTGAINVLPAKQRFENGTPNSP